MAVLNQVMATLLKVNDKISVIESNNPKFSLRDVVYFDCGRQWGKVLLEKD